MNYMTEHEAWVELATMMETMRSMPTSRYGGVDYTCYGLCSALDAMARNELITVPTEMRMVRDVYRFAHLYGGRDGHVYLWPPFDWKLRAKFCRAMARRTKPK